MRVGAKAQAVCPMHGGSMQFSDMFKARKIDPAEVLVLRHRPKEPKLRKRLAHLALERPELFNAYQQAQFPKVEKAFTRAKYIASFVGLEAGEAVFVGLYKIEGSKSITRTEFWSMSVNIELRDGHGMVGFSDSDKRAKTLWFDLVLQESFYSSWRGRLAVNWPGLERSWWRWADRNIFEITAIPENSFIEHEIPKWDELVLEWAELKRLPKKLRAALEQWRGIYYIFDISDSKGYVGSAYGKGNLRDRWDVYAKTGHGGNKWLRRRFKEGASKPENLRFSILRLLTHDEDAAEVIRVEERWKDRLHTVWPSGLNDRRSAPTRSSD